MQHVMQFFTRNLLYAFVLIGLVSFMGGAALGYLAGNRLPVNVPAAKRASYFAFGLFFGSVGLVALAMAWMEHGGVVTIDPPIYALFALGLLIVAMAAAVWRKRERELTRVRHGLVPISLSFLAARCYKQDCIFPLIVHESSSGNGPTG